MDETSQAFALPHARAAATHTGPPLDRISVRDYVRGADIGAFGPEHGVEQRLRFNVVLEVSHSAAADRDDVDQVISYDWITEAIDRVLESERVDLLETLAERIARACLTDPRAVRVFVRVEKLDRIPGALGVEIVRERDPAMAPRLRPVAAPPPLAQARPRVIFLPSADMADEPVAAWLAAVAADGRSAVVCVEPKAAQAPAMTENARRRGFLAIEREALRIADLAPGFSVIETRTELDWAVKSGRQALWAPARMMQAARGGDLPDAADPLALARWLAVELEGDLTIVARSEADVDGLPLARVVARDCGPEALAP